jgi:hypothetical protein
MALSDQLTVVAVMMTKRLGSDDVSAQRCRVFELRVLRGCHPAQGGTELLVLARYLG